MLLRFPDLDTLLLAMTTGVVPVEVAVAAAEMGCESSEPVAYWVQSEQPLPREAARELRALGVTSPRLANGIDLREVSCWMEGVPVEHIGPEAVDVSEKTPVLFELNDSDKLTELVSEILRLGNDRQGFRVCETNGQTSALLRVIGPPYYSLLRAMRERGSEDADAAGISAFVEAAPRVWVEVGCRHPLAEMIVPAAGEHVLIARDGEWRALPDLPFRDVYEVLTFQLPSQPTEFKGRELDERITIPLRLMRGGDEQATELWVLSHDAQQQIEQFVQSTADDILTRLSFAVAGEEEPTILLRVRPGRSAPPVLVFDGLQCRPYLRIPNLFLPVGQRVHPPLRRDAVKQILAPDDRQVVWIEPTEEGRFIPHSVEDAVFRPLTDWVDYVLDDHHEVLDAWRQSHRFDFEDFICRDDQPVREQRKASTSRAANARPEATPVTAEPKAEPSVVERIIKRVRPQRPRQQVPHVPEARRQLEQQLQDLEDKFKSTDVPLDDPVRLDQWRELADLNSRLGRLAEASILRQHEVWESEGARSEELSTEAVVSWFQNEIEAGRQHGATLIVDEQHGGVTELSLSRLLNSESPTPAEVGELAAYVTFATQSAHVGPLEQQRGRVGRYLLQHETLLSTRACWLSWCSLSRLAGGDTLTLARARDRMLERLHQNGVSAETDLPAFLRAAGGQSGERFRVVRDRLVKLHELVRRWSRRNLRLASQKTLHYVDLHFAFVAARMGERQWCHKLTASAREGLLDSPDAVHGWLLRAFEYRISQAEQGHPLEGPLVQSLVNQLQGIEKLQRYKVDRLRQHSSVLEPHETLDPYRDWKAHQVGTFDREVSGLIDLTDRKELLNEIKTLFSLSLADDDRARLLTVALELSPRLGEKFAVKMLEQVIPLDRKLKDPVARAALLENGLEMAAHFDQRGPITHILDRLSGLLHQQQDADVKTLEALEAVLKQSCRGLRRLGMRDELAHLLEEFADVVRPRDENASIEPERLRVLLRLAAGWFTFGQDRGRADIDRARDVLFSGSLVGEGHVGSHKQTLLASAYIAAVGEAPLEEALARWEDLFENLDGIHDASTVNTHYSLKLLDVVETLVMTIVSEGFAVDKATQRWLDEEEYLIRRRIHRDMRAMESNV